MDWAQVCSMYVHLRDKVVVQLLSCVQLFVTPRAAAFQASLSFSISWSLLKLMSIESVMPSNHLVLYCSFLLLPSIFPSIRVFSNVLAVRIRRPKYWSFTFSLSLLYGPTLTFIHDYWKNHSFDSMDFDGKVMSLLFNMLSSFLIAFLLRSIFSFHGCSHHPQ